MTGTTYVNPEILINENGMVSYLLSNRTWEVTENGEPLALGNKAAGEGQTPMTTMDIGSYLVIPVHTGIQVQCKPEFHCPKF